MTAQSIFPPSQSRNSLRFAWWVAAAVGIASFLFGGYVGWAAIFAWAALAAPLAWATTRWLAGRGMPTTRQCVLRAVASGIGVAFATLVVGIAPAWMSTSSSALLDFALSIASWAVLVGQVVFVAITTVWMLRRLGGDTQSVTSPVT
jgi:hypothetical protein